VVVFPGGIGARVLINDDEVLDWVREAHQHSRFTTPVCTGALVLAAGRALPLASWGSPHAGRDAAGASQLMIEYDPAPPFDSGSLAAATAETRELAHEYYRHRA
jgi:putative intracellular protease/amidase